MAHFLKKKKKKKKPKIAKVCETNLFFFLGGGPLMNRKRYTLGPVYWNVLVLTNTGTFLVHQHCPKKWHLRSLESADVIHKLTILKHKNCLVLSKTLVLVSGT